MLGQMARDLMKFNPDMTYEEALAEVSNTPEPVRVVVELCEGGIATAYSDTPVELIVLNHQCAEGDRTIRVDGFEMAYLRIPVEEDDDRCLAVLKEIVDDEDGINGDC